ncbi:MAG TPA: hypothetical protein VHZ55_29070 [Bryobacteraceae bacterium]|nr:hypothetical protein [Bryobacteraceae bacterium]
MTAESCGVLRSTGCTRRSLVRLGTALLLNGTLNRLLAFEVGLSRAQFAMAVPANGATWSYRQYAVHATVMLGSIPIFHKQNVGGAAVSLEAATHNQSEWTAMQFTAGSWPDRLKGFNRFGATQEIVREQNGAVVESEYRSFMSTSREKGLADARKAFTSSAERQMFTIARGRTTRGGCWFSLEHKAIEADYNWCTCVDLLADLNATADLPPKEPLTNCGPGCPPTFLFAVRRALTRVPGSDGSSVSSYVHNGKIYHLRTQTKADENSGQRMVSMRTADSNEGAEAEFKIWLTPKDATALPVKIEFRPRSFLKLTLEMDGSPGQALRPILSIGRG